MSVCVCLLFMGSVSAQTGVAPLRSSSDAGQRVFDQRVQRASAPIDTTVHELAAVDVAPVYPGGDGALFGHLAQAPGCVLEGWNADGMARTKVMLRFVVEANGSVSQLTIDEPVDAALRRHASCAAGTLQRFTPGAKDGRAVRTLLRLPLQYEPR